MQAKKDTSAAVLTPAQVDTMLQSEESFATYLAGLSPQQIRTLIENFADAEIDPEVRKALIAILRLALQENLSNESEMRKILEPEIRRVSLCMALQRQIKELEAFSTSL